MSPKKKYLKITICHSNICPKEKVWLPKSDNVVGIEKNWYDEFHLLNNFIWWFADGITPFTEVSEWANPNYNYSLSRWPSFLFTQNFDDNLGWGPLSEWAVEWIVQNIILK